MMNQSNDEKGRSYEDFVENIYEVILCAEANEGKIRQIALERNKTLKCRSGATAEFDIYWEYEIADIVFKVAIECKNYKGAVPVDDLREFAHKIDDVGSIRGLCVARNGFQRGAREVATSEDIQLINLREVEDKDWDGRIKTIGISLHIISPARIVCVEPEFNKKWSVEHGYKDGDIVTLSGLNTEIVLEDKGSDFKSSLYDMTNNEFINKSPGEHVWEKSFSDGWLRTKEKSFKVDKIRVIYSIPPPAKENIEIDFSRHVLAILEYVQRNTKFTILADGTKKEFVE